MSVRQRPPQSPERRRFGGTHKTAFQRYQIEYARDGVSGSEGLGQHEGGRSVSAFAGLGLTLDLHCCWRDGDNSNLRLAAASAISMFSLPF